jgi:hypothetical protein
MSARRLAAGAVRVGRDDLEDARADEDAIALLQVRALDLLAVDEGAVRRAEVLDRDVLVGALDARVRRETMSSTRTMSRSLERPTMISLFVPSGNSPPWYFPEMKRSASGLQDEPWEIG